MTKKHKLIKMVIWRDKEGDPCTCRTEQMINFIKPDDVPITIEKVFYALSNWDVGKIHNEHLGFGEYQGIDPDCYLDDGSECW